MTWGAVLERLASGELRATIGATFPLSRAAKALRLHESGGATGKTLLVPRAGGVA